MKCDRCGHPATIHEVIMRYGKRVERRLCERCAVAAGMVPPGGPSVSELLSQIVLPAPPNMQPSQPGGSQAGNPDSPKIPTSPTGGNVPQAGAGPAQPHGAADTAGAGLPFGIGMAMGVPIGRCPRCSATMGQLRDSGLLGCPTCYEAFLPQLLPLLQRYHEGGGFHCGKAPKRLIAGQPPRVSTRPKRKTKPAIDLVALAQQIQLLRGKLAAALIDEDYRTAAIVRDELVRLGDVQAGRAARGAAGEDGASENAEDGGRCDGESGGKGAGATEGDIK